MEEMKGQKAGLTRDGTRGIPEEKRRIGLADGRGEVVLAIEDEEIQRDFLRMALRDAGYRVMLAADGSEAVRIYLEHSNDIGLVLLDMGLPGMDGMEVLATIVGSNPNARVIAVSGSVDPEVQTAILRRGAVDYLCKPYLTKELLGKVDRVLRNGFMVAG